MVNQSRPHLLRDLNPEPEEKASELLRDLTANDTRGGTASIPPQISSRRHRSHPSPRFSGRPASRATRVLTYINSAGILLYGRVASALTLAGVLSLAPIITSLAASLAFTFVLAFA
jgi:hypothetical protein